MVIQTWVSDVHFLQNEPSEPVTGNVDNNDQFQWPESDFKQKKIKIFENLSLTASQHLAFFL